MRPTAVQACSTACVIALALTVAACGSTSPEASAQSDVSTADSTLVAATSSVATSELAVDVPVSACDEIADPVDQLAFDGPQAATEPIDQEAALYSALGWPSFVTYWIENRPDGSQFLIIGVRDRAADLQADLDANFPGARVLAIDIAYTEQSLMELQQQVAAAVEPLPNEIPVSQSVGTGLVEVLLGVITPERAAALEPFRGNPRVCVRGEVGELPPAGPQPTEGDGWRLLGEARVAGDTRTAIATDEGQYRFLWDAIGMPAAAPSVDFDTEVVVWFGNVVSSSPDCQDRLDELVVDQDAAAIHPRFSTPGGAVTCNADANPHDYVLAVERDHLPVGPFEIWLADSPNGWPGATTTVKVDLTERGSTARPEEIRFASGNPSVETLNYYERTMPVGASVVYGLPMCEGTRLGPFNRTLWLADGAAPDAWDSAPRPEGLPEFEVLVRADPPTITLSANGASLIYLPSGPWRGAEAESACTPID